MTWRVGRTLGRTIYRQLGDEPSDDDQLVGMLDTADLARYFVWTVNAAEEAAGPREWPPDE